MAFRNPTNPPSALDIGTQTANAVNALGVPIDQNSTVIYDNNVWADGDTDIFPVDNYTTLSLIVVPTGADVAGEFYSFLISWSDDAAGNFASAYDWIQSNALADSAQAVAARLIAKGRYVRIFFFRSGAAPSGFFRVHASLDTTPTNRDWLSITSSDYPVIYDGSTSVAAGGASPKIPLRAPANSQVAVQINSTGAPTGSFTVELWARTVSSGGTADQLLGKLSNGTSGATAGQFNVPFGSALYIILRNADTVSRNPGIVISDVSQR